MPKDLSRINRRRFVQGALASTTVIGGTASVDALQSNHPSQYTLEQNGKCVPIEPLSLSGLPVKEFYDYRTPKTHPKSYEYASFGTEKLQRKNTSILFLYKGPKGLSLVAVHDKIDAGDGGAVTFRISNLPVHGRFITKDDSYNSSTNLDTWDYSKHRNWKGKETASANISWTWGSGRSDGFVYRGLGENFELTIYPQFNGNANLSGENDGEVKQWEVLSGNANSPSRTKLDMNSPITISSKPCQKKPEASQKTDAHQATQTSTGKIKKETTATSQTTANRNQGSGQSVFEQFFETIFSTIETIVSFFTGLF